MQVEIIHGGRIARQINHGDKTYLVAPESGDYKIRLYNSSPTRQMAVISVDGINVINGEDAGFSGPGYVLSPWQTVEIPGWRRDGGKAASFEFQTKEGSYAAQTGRGTNNVGVIGVAVFAERVQQRVPIPVYREVHHHHHHDSLFGPVFRGVDLDTKITCQVDSDSDALDMMDHEPQGVIRSRGATKSCRVGEERTSGGLLDGTAGFTALKDVGTGYGHEQTFHTHTTEFQKATTEPSQIIRLFYATVERLKTWGVPVDMPTAATIPNPFPMSQGSVPAPPGWRG